MQVIPVYHPPRIPGTTHPRWNPSNVTYGWLPERLGGECWVQLTGLHAVSLSVAVAGGRAPPLSVPISRNFYRYGFGPTTKIDSHCSITTLRHLKEDY